MASGAITKVLVDQDAPPIAKIFAHEIRRVLHVGHRQHLVAGLPACFALVSTVDPQKVSIHIRDGEIRVTGDLAAEAVIEIHLDFNRMEDPTAKPKVKGLWRHPLYAMRIDQFLKPVTTTWTDDAKRFWQLVQDTPDLPTAIQLISLSDERSITLGEAEPELCIYGQPADLVRFLTGGNLLVQDIILGRLKVEASLKQIAVLTGVTQRLMLGEYDHRLEQAG